MPAKTVHIRLLWLLCGCFVQLYAFGQGAAVKGDRVQLPEVKRLLNDNNPAASFKPLQKKITILDFFGTWCVPCLKALPHLTALSQQFKSDVQVVLVSTETEPQLAKFIKARSNFPFPVIVDEGEKWNALFQPPALPYTVVLNRQGRIIAITEAEAITQATVTQWLLEADSNALSITPFDQVQKKPPAVVMNKKSANTVVRLSQEFIYAAKTGDTVATLLQQLSRTDYKKVADSLQSDNSKKAFWINLYNGYTQAALKAAPELYKNRGSFFGQPWLDVAGRQLSLDDIEHGFLRRSKIKWSLGYLNKLFPSKAEKVLRVNEVDYRIHFALNCGAKSCPPIAFYNDETLDAQLDLATKAYLSGEAEWDSAKNTVRLPKLMSWFRADFGGKKGMIKILKSHGIIPVDAAPKIRFKPYDWTLSLNNTTNENP